MYYNKPAGMMWMAATAVAVTLAVLLTIWVVGAVKDHMGAEKREAAERLEILQEWQGGR